MSHYDTREWLLYKQNRVAPHKRSLMEKHLARCEACLRDYLGTVGEQEEELAALLLPPGFNNRVLRAVRDRKVRLSRSRRSRMLINYITAASITLALAAGGVFDTVIRQVPGAIKESETVTQALFNIDLVASWPEWLMEATAAGMNKLWQTKED